MSEKGVLVRLVWMVLMVMTCCWLEVKADYTPNMQYKLCVCAITQNEGRFLKEWIEFHRLQGVDHFLIWDNASTDNTLEVLTPYINSGVVEYTYAPMSWGFPQVKCYEDCIEQMVGKTEWMLVLDTDEYCFSYGMPLSQFLDEFSDQQVGGVAFNWQMYGTSNVEEIPTNQLMIENLVMKAPRDHDENRHVKICVKPEKVKAIVNPHVFRYYGNCQTVTTGWAPVEHHVTDSVNISRARINHYWCRDKKFFQEEKIKRRKFTCNDDEGISRCREILYNTEKDETMLDFVPQLSKSMCQARPPKGV